MVIVDWFALGFLEALECGKMGVMTKETPRGIPTTRRYTNDEEDQAVRLVFELHKVLDTTQGTVVRIADQLGYAAESPRRAPLCHGGGGGGLPVSARQCPWAGSLTALQDALRTRFIEN